MRSVKGALLQPGFTRALTEHSGMVLRRLSSRTENTAPVMTLTTQFGGGKTHTLTSLYHLANAGREARHLPGVTGLLAPIIHGWGFGGWVE